MRKIFVLMMFLFSSCAFIQKQKAVELITPVHYYKNNEYIYFGDVKSPSYLDTDDMPYIYKHELRYFAKHRFACNLNCIVKEYLLKAMPYLEQKELSQYKLSVYIYDFEPHFESIHKGYMLLRARFYLKAKNTCKIKDFYYKKAFYVEDFNALMLQEQKALDDMAKSLDAFLKKSI